MKFLIAILTIALVSRDCGNKSAIEASLADNTQHTVAIIYQASSRGFFEEITVSKQTITLSNDRSGKNIQSFETTTEHWNICLKLLAEIDLQRLPNIEAPTAMRDIDGAAHATLTIKESNQEIKSKIFDHEYPPTEIKTLVEKLLSFKKNSPKQ